MAATPATPAEIQLAVRLRQLRDDASLTQTQLARLFSTEEQVSPATVSSWENTGTSATPPEHRLEPYARLFVPSGSTDGIVKLIPLQKLSSEQQRLYRELLAELEELWSTARGRVEEAAAVAAGSFRSWFFDDAGSVMIICPEAPKSVRGALADPNDPNYNQAHELADLDALIEVYGFIRAENASNLAVDFKSAAAVGGDELSGHLVLLGGTGWNSVTGEVLRNLTQLPVRQEDDPSVGMGEVFAVDHGVNERRFLPKLAPDGKTLIEDVGLLARLRNPYNVGRTLTILNGVSSRGVLGVVRALTHPPVREGNESYLADRFGSDDYAILAKVPVVAGGAVAPDLRNPANILYAWSSNGGNTSDE